MYERRYFYPIALLFGSFVLFFLSSVPYLEGGAPYGDDHSAHYALCLHIARLLRAGETNFFWEQTNLGLPLFASYQPLPSLFTGAMMVFMKKAATLTFFKLVVVFVWGTMPCSWYLGARWVGMCRVTSVILGLLTLTIRADWHVGFSLTSSAYEGLFTQSWGFWFFPLAIGAFYRGILQQKMSWPWVSVLLSLTMMSHLFSGLLAVIVFGCIVVVQPKKRLFLSKPIVLVGVTSFVLCGFWLIPLLLTREYLGGIPWLNANYSGWPLAQTAKAFLGGQVLDASRWPIMTFSVIGIALGSLKHVRTSINVRIMWLFFLLSWFLMGGREVWGTWYLTLPMHSNVNPVRYLSALQLVGSVAAAHFISKIWYAGRTFYRLRIFVTMCVLVAWAVQQHQFVQRVLKTKPWFESPLHRVAGELAIDSGHRFMVDSDYATGSHFHRDLLPMLASRPQLQSYALGYHATMSTYYAEHLRLNLPSLRLFNVSSLITRNNAKVPDVFQFYRAIDEYKIYEIPSSKQWGYFDLVWPGPQLSGPLREMRPKLREMAPVLFAERYVAVLKSEPQSALRIEEDFVKKSPPKGTIISTERGLNHFRSRVFAEPGAWLLLKVTYFPFWHATIDGNDTQIYHVGPNFMAVQLPGGTHDIVFSYENPWFQKTSAVFSLLSLLTWILWSLRRRLRFHERV